MRPLAFANWCGGEATCPQAVRRKAHRRRERFSPALEHLWRLRPPLFLSGERTATQLCHRMSAVNGLFGSNVEGGEIGRQYGKYSGKDEIVMAARRLQPEPASRAWLEDELSKLPAQKLAAGRILRDSQGAAPHGGAEPLDQPRLADDQAVALPSGRAGDHPRRGRRRHAAVFSAAILQRRRRGRSDRRRGGRGPRGAVRSGRTAGAMAPAAGAAPPVTVSRSGSTSRSTSALWSRATGEIETGDRHANVSSLVPLTWVCKDSNLGPADYPSAPRRPSTRVWAPCC